MASRLFLTLGAIAVWLATGAQLTHDTTGSHQLLRADPKKKEAAKEEKGGKKDAKGGKKEDLMKKMPLKAAEQGFEGKKVKHSDGKTAAADWQNEYGESEKKAPPLLPKKSGSVRS